jgi:hypothetical protein
MTIFFFLYGNAGGYRDDKCLKPSHLPLFVQSIKDRAAWGDKLNRVLLTLQLQRAKETQEKLNCVFQLSGNVCVCRCLCVCL